LFVSNDPHQHQWNSVPERPPQWKLGFAEPSRALHLRNELIEYLRAYGRTEDDYDTAELIFDELVANVCFHAPGPIEILVEWHSGRAMLHVTDAGPPLDMSAIAFPDPYADDGRGLAIVSALSAAVRSTTYVCGKTVSAALPILVR
jgi:anti-sigma regulatory factor (Ser/Thr protein kinase)